MLTLFTTKEEQLAKLTPLVRKYVEENITLRRSDSIHEFNANDDMEECSKLLRDICYFNLAIEVNMIKNETETTFHFIIARNGDSVSNVFINTKQIPIEYLSKVIESVNNTFKYELESVYVWFTRFK